MVEFAGYEMPVHYTSILAEHRAVREAAGLFDVSHVGQIGLAGSNAAASADHLLSRAASTLRPERVRYALLCNEEGGVVDDVTLYRADEESFFLCVNAANVEKDYRWCVKHALAGTDVRNQSEETGLLALQGPASPEVMARVTDASVTGLRRYAFGHFELAGFPALISRTGYTGSDGFEIYTGAGRLVRAFEALLEAGKPLGLVPVGLGARDTLRLEAAMPLYGHELDDTTSPLEAGLDRFVELEGRAFVGREAIVRRRDEPATRTLVGFAIEGRGVARADYPVLDGDREVGRVTSGAPSPILGHSIGLAYVAPDCAAIGTQLDISIRGRATPARVVETPFVKAPSASGS
jgi:aminomethyltransferase